MMTAGHPRRGNVSLWVIGFLFISFALLGLLIDLGFARLAQRQMQAATNTAALEGLRYQDEIPEPVAATLPPCPGCPPDEVRRRLARRILQLSFDDNYDLSDANGTIGAGPENLFNHGGWNAVEFDQAPSALLQAAASGDYTFRAQSFELNTANEESGDLVSGNWSAVPPAENQAYQRTDFSPSTTTPTAFLARLRRTGNRTGTDEVAGVSSHGNPLPVWFGRLSMLAQTSEPGTYDVRQHGLELHATSIASQSPAMMAGPSPLSVAADPTAPPFFPWAISRADWNALPGNPAAVGTWGGGVVSVGQSVTPTTPTDPWPSVWSVAAIYAPDLPVPRIIGFGWVKQDDGNPLLLSRWQASGQPGSPRNATSRWVIGGPGVSTSELSSLWAEVTALRSETPESLVLVPVLRRAIR